MKDMFISLLIVAAILMVCGVYFKAVILNWLSHDAELRALMEAPAEEPAPTHH